jgi:hypothetical protein
MSRKAIYENPSQRKSVEEAFSTERFVRVRRKTLVCKERAGVLRITRIRINKMMVAGWIQVKRRDNQLMIRMPMESNTTKKRKILNRGGGTAVKIDSGRK